MSVALLALVVVPVVGGVVLLLAGPAAHRLAAPLALVTTTVVLGLAVVVTIARPALSVPMLTGIEAGLAVDGLSAVLVLTVAAVALAVTAVAVAEGTAGRGTAGGGAATPRFLALLLVFLGAMLLTVTATTLLTLLAGWEVMGAMSYALVAHRWREQRPAASGAVAFLTTRAADVGLYLAAGAAVAGGAGSLSLAELTQAGPGWREVLTAGLVLAALGKSAQVPFSFWLARAMDGPSPASALLHSATMVAAGGYLLLRVQPLLATSAWAGPLVAWVGVATVVLLGLVALAQTDLKLLLAASTCSQLGFVVLGAGVGASAGGALQLVAHAATKSLLFLVAGLWLTALGTKQLAGLGGAARRWPLVGLVFTVGALSLAGVPPLSIFFGKDAVLAGAAASSPALYAAGLAGVVVSAAYAGLALVVVLGRGAAHSGEASTTAPGTGSVPRAARAPLVVLAVAAATLGAAAEPVRAALGAAGEPAPTLLEALASAGLAVATLGAVAWLSTRTDGAQRLARVGWLHHWLGLERAATVVVAAPTMALARTLAAFDDRALARTVTAAAAGTRVTAATLARLDSRGLDRAVDAVVAGTRAAARRTDAGVESPLAASVDGLGTAGRALGRLARRPQTGQLHHYYAQAAGTLAVLALFLILVR